MPTIWPASLWHATATPLDDYPALEGETECEVGILGAGYTGLSTALHLAEQGIGCAIVDQAQPGWGCSGRNGGQVNPMWKVLPEKIRHRYGSIEFEAMVELVSRTCDLVFELIERHQIDCDAVQLGHVHTAIGRAQMQYAEQWNRQWRGFDNDLSLLDRDQVARMTGTTAYDGATFAKQGGSVQPLSYARGLARAATRLGAHIFGDSQVTSITRRGDRWAMSTPGGTLLCRNLAIGANGYTDRAWPGLEKTIVPVASLITATEPLAEEVAAAITPGRQTVSESSGLPHYYRLDTQNRMVFGGRGSISGKLGTVDTRGLRAEAIKLYPALQEACWTHDWGGYVAMTADHRPVMLELDSGVYAGLGYNGRGVAMATMMGKQLAALISTGKADLQLEKPRTIPLHGFYPVGVAARIVSGRVRDRLTARL